MKGGFRGGEWAACVGMAASEAETRCRMHSGTQGSMQARARVSMGEDIGQHTCRRVGPLHHAASAGEEGCLARFSPLGPTTGSHWMAFSLKPQDLGGRKGAWGWGGGLGLGLGGATCRSCRRGRICQHARSPALTQDPAVNTIATTATARVCAPEEGRELRLDGFKTVLIKAARVQLAHCHRHLLNAQAACQLCVLARLPTCTRSSEAPMRA